MSHKGKLIRQKKNSKMLFESSFGAYVTSINKTKCLTHDYPQVPLKSKLCYGKK